MTSTHLWCRYTIPFATARATPSICAWLRPSSLSGMALRRFPPSHHSQKSSTPDPSPGSSFAGRPQPRKAMMFAWQISP